MRRNVLGEIMTAEPVYFSLPAPAQDDLAALKWIDEGNPNCQSLYDLSQDDGQNTVLGQLVALGPIAPANSEVPTLLAPSSQGTADCGDRSNEAHTLESLLQTIALRRESVRRHRFPASKLRVESDRLIAGNEEFVLGTEGLRRLCKWLRAPADYLASLKPALRARILQAHFAEGRAGNAKLTDHNSCVLVRNGTFLDLGRDDLFTLENDAVVTAVSEGIGGDATVLEVQNFHLDDESLVIDLVSPQLAEEVRPGDVIRGGVHVSHSQLDGQATQVLAYIVRLVCSNGLVQRQCLGKKQRSTPRTRRLSVTHPAARELQVAQIRKLVADTWGGVQERLSAIRRLGDKVVEIRTTLERFLLQAHLFSHSLMDRLLKAWEKEGAESSAFGALNALTRVATHAQELPAWQRQRLARLAGIYANQDVHLCPHCFSILATR